MLILDHSNNVTYAESFMKSYFLLLFFIILTPFLGAQEDLHSIREGSLEEKAFIDEMKVLLEGLSLEYTQRNYLDEEFIHSFGNSIEIHRKGSGKNHLILVFSLNSETPGLENRLKLINDLIQTLAVTPARSDLTILLLSGEEDKTPVGTSVYLDRSNLDTERTGLIYLDTGNNLSQLAMEAGSAGTVTPLWFTQGLTEALIRDGIPCRLDGTKLQIIRTGFTSETPYIAPYLNQGIASVLIKSQKEGLPSTQLERDRFVRSLMQFYLNFENLDPALSDQNYFLMYIKNQVYFISEAGFLVAYLGFFALILLLILFQFRNVLFNLRKFKRQFWVVFLSYSLIFILLMLSTLLMEELGYLLGDSLIWLAVPLPGFLFKTTITFIFTSFFLFTLRGMPIPRTPHFYSYSAVFITFFNLILFSFMEVTLSYFWIWTMLFSLLFTMSRKLGIKILALVFIPLPFILALLSVINGSYPDLQRIFIQSRIGGNLFLAVNLLPGILLLTSLHYHRYYYQKERISLVGPLTLGLCSLAALIFLGFFVFESSRITEENRNIVLSGELFPDEKRGKLTLSSNREMGNLSLYWAGRMIPMTRLGKEAEVELSPPDKEWLLSETTHRRFLDRRYEEISLKPLGNPDTVQIRMLSENSFLIYDCNYPYEMNPQGLEAELFIGNFPPVPFPLEITLNRNAKVWLECTFVYSSWPENVSIEGANWELGKMTISRKIPLWPLETNQ